MSELVVRNVGPSVAKNVKVDFDPPIPADEGTVAKYIHDRYSTPLVTVAPGRELTNIYATLVRDGTSKTTEDVPHDFTISFTYADADTTMTTVSRWI